MAKVMDDPNLLSEEEFEQLVKVFIIASLRRASYRWKPRYMVMNDARVERGKYKCNLCQAIVGRKFIALDHIEPVVDPTQGFVGFDTYIKRMFCRSANFQAICKACHKMKCAQESGLRKEMRKILNPGKKSIAKNRKLKDD